MAKKVGIVGLGYFGFHLAKELKQSNHEVLAIEIDQGRAELASSVVDQIVILDCTDEKAMLATGMGNCDIAIVAIGEDFESSLLAVTHLQNIGIKRILARAISKAHERILKQMGIKEILVPEWDAAFKLAQEISVLGMRNSIAISKNHSIVELDTPKWVQGKTLEELDLRKEYGLNIVGLVKEIAKSTLK